MDEFLVDLSVVLVGSAVLSFLAVLSKQPLIIAYLVCGIILGPWGIGLVKNASFIETISHLGITLLLFLTGLTLHPQKLMMLFKRTSLVTLANCLLSFAIAFGFSFLLKFNLIESFCIGLALMFSSTILTIKLLPTTKLHQQRMGAVCISVLIMQDLVAISALVLIRSMGDAQGILVSFPILLIKVAVFIGALFLIEQFVLRKVMWRVDQFHEALFILGLAWCFGVASISYKMGLFFETGAFFAGVVLARHKISLFISEELKPLRDFFLVLFFFTMGANLDFDVMHSILLPALALAVIYIFVKPWVFKKSFILSGESKEFSKEIGLRLGQLSEFALLIAILSLSLGHISSRASQFIQLVTSLTFIISSYIVVFKYPTPIGPTEKLNKI